MLTRPRSKLTACTRWVGLVPDTGLAFAAEYAQVRQAHHAAVLHPVEIPSAHYQRIPRQHSPTPLDEIKTRKRRESVASIFLNNYLQLQAPIQ
jgi:hypothetical protein